MVPSWDMWALAGLGVPNGKEIWPKAKSFKLPFVFCEPYEHIFKTAGGTLCISRSSWSRGSWVLSMPINHWQAPPRIHLCLPPRPAEPEILDLYRPVCREHLMTAWGSNPRRDSLHLTFRQACSQTFVTARPHLLASPRGAGNWLETTCNNFSLKCNNIYVGSPVRTAPRGKILRPNTAVLVPGWTNTNSRCARPPDPCVFLPLTTS